MIKGSGMAGPAQMSETGQSERLAVMPRSPWAHTDRGLRRGVALAVAALLASFGVPGVALASKTFVVNTSADSGAGSLRNAISSVDADTSDSSNSPDVIDFAGGPFVIRPSTQLPQITAPVDLKGDGSTIDDSLVASGDALVLQAASPGITGSDGSTVSGLTIEGAAQGAGISIVSNHNTIQGNTIGVSGAGNEFGISLYGSNNTIGGAPAGAGNTISGNTRDGIFLIGPNGSVSAPTASANVIEGNTLGSSTGAGNGNAGVEIGFGATDNTVGGLAAGAGNLISGNGAAGNGTPGDTGPGVLVQGMGTSGNTIEDNLIGTPNPNIEGGVKFANSASGNSVVGGTVSASTGTSAIDAGNEANTVSMVSLGGQAPLIIDGQSGTVTPGTATLRGNGASIPVTVSGPSQGASVEVDLLSATCNGNAASVQYIASTDVTIGAGGTGMGTITTSGAVPAQPVFDASDAHGPFNLADPCPFMTTGGAPVLKLPPTITGSPVQGHRLIASTGTWTNSPIGFDYQWQRCDQTGAACTPIPGAGGFVPGATAFGYTLTAADVGHTLRVMVTAGNATADSAPALSSTSVVVTAASVPMPLIAFGSAPGHSPEVSVIDAATGDTLATFFAFDQSFTGGVSLAWADFNGDGIPDLVAGAGPGGLPEAKVFNGADLVAGRATSLLPSFSAFAPTFTGGLSVAAADVNGDGIPDLVVGAGRGGGPEVKVFTGAGINGQGGTPSALADFFAFPPSFTGGVTVASADVGSAHDVLVGVASGGQPQVKVFDGTQLTEAKGAIPGSALLANFDAFDPSFLGGVSVSADGVTGSSAPQVVAGTGPGAHAEVKVFDGATHAPLGDYQPFGSFAAGVNVAASGGDVVVAPAQGGSNAELFAGASGTPQDLFVPFTGYTGGSVAADLSGPVASTGSPIRLPPLPPVSVIGSTVVTGTAATVPVGCTGGTASQCSIAATLTVSAFVQALAPDATAIDKKRNKPKRRTVAVGSARATIRAGRSKTLKISLNPTGKRLLAKNHKLKVKLVITQHGRKVLSTTITFKAKPAHKHKR